MKITNLSLQVKNKDRVNIFIDEVYFCSLELWQIGELKIKKDLEIDQEFKQKLQKASQFGKVYIKTVNYCLLRPHSKREIEDYIGKKFYKMEIKDDLMFENIVIKLEKNNLIDDQKFAEWWVENRNLRKGSSFKKMTQELCQKGVSQKIIDQVLAETDRDEMAELQKVIAKKQNRYSDEQKLIRYLIGRGFSYDLIKQALEK